MKLTSKRNGLLALLVVLIAGVIIVALLNSGQIEAPAKPAVTQQSQQDRLRRNAGSTGKSQPKTTATSAKPSASPQPAEAATHLTNTGPGNTIVLFVVAAFAGYLSYTVYLVRTA